MELKDVLEDIRSKAVVPLWPHVGLALNIVGARFMRPPIAMKST